MQDRLLDWLLDAAAVALGIIAAAATVAIVFWAIT
jgi:hypothetical protein